MEKLLLLLVLFGSNAKAEPSNIYFSKIYGSGILIKVKEKSYFMTNSHVCLSDDKKIVSFKIKTRKKEYREKDLIKNFIIDKENDLCFIPTNIESNTYSLSKKTLKKYEKIYYEVLTSNKKINKKDGRVVSFESNLKVLNLKDSYNDQKNGVLISTSTVSGDSGSAVFNENDELIGVVFASAKIGNLNWGIMTPISSIKFLQN